MRFRLATMTMLATLAAAPSLAQPFQGIEYDQNLNMALQEMLGSFGNACQTMGDPDACGAFNYVQQAANYMVGASNACVQGDQGGCEAYQMTVRDVEATYANYSQMMYGGAGMAPATSVNPLGDTHADRMGAIAQFGADNTAAFNQRITAMDNNMAQWQATN